jgi:hypothetical protein
VVDDGHFRQLVDRADMVGVGHLKLAGENLQLSAHRASLSRWQHTAQVIGVSMEKHQVKAPGVVTANDPVGVPGVLRGEVFRDLERQGGDPIGFGLGQLWRIAPVDNPAGQMPAKIDDLGTGQKADQLGEARSDARQRFHQGEQSEEDLRSQGAIDP